MSAALPAAAAPGARRDGRLLARAGRPDVELPYPTGVTRLGVGGKRHALLYASALLLAPPPLLVLLHGAGGNGADMLEAFRPHADRLRFAILAPQSIGTTWPVGRPLGGEEIAAIDAALAAAFARVPVDPKRIGIGGFSDGASYALSLGFANGGLFSDILAFSPGGFVGEASARKPRVFIGHGRSDGVLPFRNAKDMESQIRRAGYDVEFHAFAGGHRMTEPEIDAALARFLGRPTK
jgi:predicted esterase